MATGAAAWAVGTLVYDLDPATDDFHWAYKLSSLLFQLGLVALVGVQLRTRATGTGRLARRFLHAEHVMLGLAIASSLQWLLAPDLSENPFFLALDLFWPLSMLGHGRHRHPHRDRRAVARRRPGLAGDRRDVGAW